MLESAHTFNQKLRSEIPSTIAIPILTNLIIQVRSMLQALKYSNEPEHLVNEARRYLRGLKGNLVQLKKQKEAKALAAREAYAAEAFQRSMNPGGGYLPGTMNTLNNGPTGYGSYPGP